jgi:hypothetical protein
VLGAGIGGLLGFLYWRFFGRKKADENVSQRLHARSWIPVELAD